MITVVLGGSGGIGSELLRVFSGSGEGQVLGAFRKDCDVSNDESVGSFFSRLNRIDCDPAAPLYVVNATGHLWNGLCHKYSESDLLKTLDVNVAGSYRVARHFRTAAKTRPGSSLLLLSSVVGRLGVAGATAYGAAKSAIHGLVRGLSKEYARIGARVNVVEMGYFSRGMIEKIPRERQEEILSTIPLGVFGDPESLASLCREVLRNQYMTGAIVPITGGL